MSDQFGREENGGGHHSYGGGFRQVVHRYRQEGGADGLHQRAGLRW